RAREDAGADGAQGRGQADHRGAGGGTEGQGARPDASAEAESGRGKGGEGRGEVSRETAQTPESRGRTLKHYLGATLTPRVGGARHVLDHCECAGPAVLDHLLRRRAVRNRQHVEAVPEG